MDVSDNEQGIAKPTPKKWKHYLRQLLLVYILSLEKIIVHMDVSKNIFRVNKVNSMFLRPIKKNNNFMVPFYGWGSTASRLELLRGSSLLFTTKFPEILVLILSTSEEWKAELTLEPSSGFKHRTSGIKKPWRSPY